jgi:predicted amidohydrolase
MKSIIRLFAIILNVTTSYGFQPRNPVAASVFQGDSSNRIRIALVAMKSNFSDYSALEVNQTNIKENIRRHLYFIDRAADQGADFVGFPELSLSGYHFSENTTWLDREGAEVIAIAAKAREKKIYVCIGLAEKDADGHRWNTQIVIGPNGNIIGWHHKNFLTEETHTQPGTDQNIFIVKGCRMGIAICADGSNFSYLKKLAYKGAQIIFAPHATAGDGTMNGWYAFRSRWAGKWDGQMTHSDGTIIGVEAEAPSGGWISQLKVFAALVNNAGLYNLRFDPPVEENQDVNSGWAGGAWVIGPDGKTMSRISPTTITTDGMEEMLVCDIDLPDF